MPQWHPDILNTLIAPGIAGFDSALIPDLDGEFLESEHWCTNHFLNSVFCLRWSSPVRQIAIGFMRRADHAHTAYQNARTLTLDYVKTYQLHNPSIRGYYNAVSAWETFAIDFTIACDLFKWFNQGTGAFSKKDGSKEMRLYEIGNKVKHLPKCVNAKELTRDDVLPLWIDADGLHSFQLAISFEECAQILRDICRVADEFQSPVKFREKTEELNRRAQLNTD